MDNKVFYGEYTLFHLIELILHKNIVLPDYQRCFVWTKTQTESFLRNLRDEIFVPPIIIGALSVGGSNKNIILDGQQRLTSILLGYLGIFPNSDSFKLTDMLIYHGCENEDVGFDDDADIGVEWTFRMLISDDNCMDKSTILERIDKSKYIALNKDACLDVVVLKKIYLGFSYIVPAAESENEQHRFYSTVFHDINQQGVALRSSESRRSLYYLNNDLVPYFEPVVSRKMRILQNGKVRMYDYVRALAFMSDYLQSNNEATVAKGYRGHGGLEAYFDDFINAVVLDKADSKFGLFSKVVGFDMIETRCGNLKSNYEKLLKVYDMPNDVFHGIIEADLVLFGLVYFLVLKGAVIGESQFKNLVGSLQKKLSDFRKDEQHCKSPNALRYIRVRIKTSVEIYSSYVKQD